MSFLFAVTMSDLWVLCNRLLTDVFGRELEVPATSGAVFARVHRQRWMADLFDPGWNLPDIEGRGDGR